MGHHQLEDPLVPGMAPTATRLLAVGGDTTKLGHLVTNLRLRGYQVTSSTDPAAATAGLRRDGLQSFNFDVVMVDAEFPGGERAAANKLFEFAVREPLLCAYGIRGENTFGPLAMEDLDKLMKPIYTVGSNGPNSPKASLNGVYNTSPSTTTSSITNFSFSRREVERRSKKHTRGTYSHGVEQVHNPKKPRVVWTYELHKEFLEAIDKLVAAGEDPVPKKILHVMNNPTLEREHIASHLQKYRLHQRRKKASHPLRRSNSRTKHHRLARKASLPSRNKASQHQAPTTVMKPNLSTTVYINCDINAHTMVEASTKSDMQDNRLVIQMQTFKATDKSNQSVQVDVPQKDMNPGADDPKQNSYVGNSDGDGNRLHKNLSDILADAPEPSWETEFLF